jgi:hypothetical protein
MATCPYCQETIAAGAQKCRYCHSVLFERSPEKGKDSAEFVIKFVGFSVAVLSCVGVISGIVFAALGVKSFGDLNQKLNADIEQVKTQIKQDTERLRIENNSLLHEVRASIIETSYERYQHIINSLVLDEISRPIVDELDQILSRVKSLKPHTKILEEKIGEIGSIIQSVKDYRSRDFEVALKIADATSARTPARYRMLCSINSQLVAKYSSSSKELAAKFLESFDNCTRIFLELSPTTIWRTAFGPERTCGWQLPARSPNKSLYGSKRSLTTAWLNDTRQTGAI